MFVDTVFVFMKCLTLTIYFRYLKCCQTQHNKPNFSGQHFMYKLHLEILVLWDWRFGSYSPDLFYNSTGVCRVPKIIDLPTCPIDLSYIWLSILFHIYFTPGLKWIRI